MNDTSAPYHHGYGVWKRTLERKPGHGATTAPRPDEINYIDVAQHARAERVSRQQGRHANADEHRQLQIDALARVQRPRRLPSRPEMFTKEG